MNVDITKKVDVVEEVDVSTNINKMRNVFDTQGSTKYAGKGKDVNSYMKMKIQT